MEALVIRHLGAISTQVVEVDRNGNVLIWEVESDTCKSVRESSRQSSELFFANEASESQSFIEQERSYSE